MSDLSRTYIEQAAKIYLLKDHLDVSGEDSLVKLFEELMHIIFYGDIGDLIVFSHKAYELNMQVHGDDPLGHSIKNFITLYLNDAIEETLLR
jgi:hypothetical protein